MSIRSREKRKLRKEVEFELNPARCGNCINFIPPKMGLPNKRIFKPAHCSIHDFDVKKTSICNYWEGKKGEVLQE